MPSIVVYNFGRISIVLRRHFPDALAWGQAGFEGLGILSGDGRDGKRTKGESDGWTNAWSTSLGYCLCIIGLYGNSILITWQNVGSTTPYTLFGHQYILFR